MIRSEKNTGSDTTVGDPDPPPGEAAEEHKKSPGDDQYEKQQLQLIVIHRAFKSEYLAGTCAWLQQAALEALTNSARTDSPRRIGRNEFRRLEAAAAAAACVWRGGRRLALGIQLAVGPQPLRLRNHNSGLAQRIMVKRLATSPHDPLGITDSACKNQLVVVSVQYGLFNPYIPIRSTTIGKSRVAIDTIAMHTSWRSNSDIASVTSIGYPRMSASGESSTTMHRLLHASGSHPILTPYDPKY
ncbi:hypothetical protein F511_04026 [Dorcoceras hygrometricum]|uniref:Uncharacterized protein n=1 Tax=Dorcoceras hygrometricum TaxID=472368 RepID=A0A2Z7BJK5_9LAMI|nr:hypothetical protein F511_04026 [Dorcoceras hygrometricum]